MSSAIGAVCQFVRTIIGGVNLFTNVKQIVKNPPQDPSSRSLHIAATVLQGACFAANTTAVGASCLKAGNDTLAAIKAIELIPQTLNVPLQAVKAHHEIKKGQVSPVGAMENCFESVVSVARCFSEQQCYQYKYYLSLPPEEFEKLKFPIYDQPKNEYESSKIVGWHQVTREECRKSLEAAEKGLPLVSTVEITLKLGAVAKISSAMHQVYQRVFNQLAACTIPAEANAKTASAKPIDPLSVKWVDLPFIPVDLHSDVFFSRFVCPITRAPIRHPVADPDGTTLYEREAIVRRIQLKHASSITRTALAINQLIPRPALQAAIDDRLNFHQQQYQQAIQAGLVVAPPANLTQAALKENPNY